MALADFVNIPNMEYSAPHKGKNACSPDLRVRTQCKEACEAGRIIHDTISAAAMRFEKIKRSLPLPLWKRRSIVKRFGNDRNLQAIERAVQKQYERILTGTEEDICDALAKIKEAMAAWERIAQKIINR
jgi:hypothetical protein